jgi:exodeoxyribonuclease VIII
MNNAEYHSHPAVSKSHLDQIAKSPLHYWARYLDPNREVPEPTAAMAIGSAVHTHVLELDQWDANYVVMPEGINKLTKAGKAEWEAFKAAANGRTVLSRSDADLVMRIGQAVLTHPAAAFLLSRPGKAETTHMWTDAETGLACKCRPDWITDDGDLVVDLKTTQDASSREFANSCAKFRYHVQAGFYCDGLAKANAVEPSEFIFIAVETKPPFGVAVYAASPEMKAAGRRRSQQDLAKLAECKAANSWPSYSTDIQPLDLPKWIND